MSKGNSRRRRSQPKCVFTVLSKGNTVKKYIWGGNVVNPPAKLNHTVNEGTFTSNGQVLGNGLGIGAYDNIVWSDAFTKYSTDPVNLVLSGWSLCFWEAGVQSPTAWNQITDKCRLRISAQPFPVEIGWYKRPAVPLEQRTCPHCPEEVIEDECHFMTECVKYETGRKIMFDSIQQLCPNFEHLTLKEKFIYIMSAEGPTAQIMAKFIADDLP